MKAGRARTPQAMLRRHSGYVKSKQFSHAENVVRAMKRYLASVADDAGAALEKIVPRNAREMALVEQLRGLLGLSRKLIAQDKDTPGRDNIYFVHEPQVECIAKGKVHKRYEFGVNKGRLRHGVKDELGTRRDGAPGNPYDGNMLAQMLAQAEDSPNES